MTTAPAATQQFNNGARPLIMAYIGNDEPERGDSKGSIGLAQNIAEQMGGDYIYVDDSLLKKLFPHIDEKKRMTSFLEKKGTPDIALGTRAHRFEGQRGVYAVTGYNETLCEDLCSNETMLVAHNLTRNLLAFERAKFKSHYPQIDGPLIAVMMGGGQESFHNLALHLIELAAAHPKITLFICPSRRTENDKEELLPKIEKYLNTIESIQSGTKSVPHYMKNLIASISSSPAPQNLREKMAILHVDYQEALQGYNPYLGLLASADHIIVTGRSRSLVSEALYAGKAVYLAAENHAEIRYYDLFRKGHIKDLLTTDCTKPLPACSVPLYNITAAVAERIISQYQIYRRQGQGPAPGAAP